MVPLLNSVGPNPNPPPRKVFTLKLPSDTDPLKTLNHGPFPGGNGLVLGVKPLGIDERPRGGIWMPALLTS